MNPIAGRDPGPRPTFGATAGSYATYPGVMPGYGRPVVYPPGAGVAYPIPGMPGPYPQQMYFQAQPVPQIPGQGYPGIPPIAAWQPNGMGVAYARGPQTHPAIDIRLPAANMTNSTGGTGCEPGYNYFFAPEHTKIHVFKCRRPPWQEPPHTNLPFHAVHVPVNTTLGEILKGFGCNNVVPKKNRCYEVFPGGNGTWYKGMSFGGDEKEMVKKTLKEVGWDASRNGQPGGKPVVCLYLTKD